MIRILIASITSIIVGILASFVGAQLIKDEYTRGFVAGSIASATYWIIMLRRKDTRHGQS